jgi:hypothetical protein
MTRFTASIRKYLGRSGVLRRSLMKAARSACQRRADRVVGKRRRGTQERVSRRPDPNQWSDDELLALHEAVALLWPSGPVTVSSLRTAIASGQLAHARIAGRIYTTRAALAAMAACRKPETAVGGGGAPGGVDWDARLATLLPPRRGSRCG